MLVFRVSGLYQYVPIKLNVNLSSVTFYIAVDVTLTSVNCQSSFVYLEYVMVFLKPLQQRASHLQRVWTVQQSSPVALSLNFAHYL